MNNFAIRRLSSTDSIDEIIRMLQRAFAPMASLGANCLGVDQSASTTRQRMERGDCLLAVSDGRIIGTLTLQTYDPLSEVTHYRNPNVASLHQFAVAPEYQGGGVGRSMLKVATMWARMREFSELALDTPAVALDARDFYSHQGFAFVQVNRLAGRNYDSVIMSKPLSLGHQVHPGGVPRSTESGVATEQSQSRFARWLH